MKKDSSTEYKDDVNQPVKATKNNKRDTSIVIAVIAVLISLVSTFIGLKESQIMQEQQKISIEQQAASVWPYIENIPFITIHGRTELTYELMIKNKGVGPAIIGEVQYKLQNKIIEASSGLVVELNKQYPKLKCEIQRNSSINNLVLAPQENYTVIKVKITKQEEDSTNITNVLNELNLNLNYCYCSIYGTCWKIEDNIRVNSSNECKTPEILK